VAGISPKYRIFSSGQGKKTVAVEITHGSKTFTAVSIYLDSGKDMTEDFNKIKNILHLRRICRQKKVSTEF
jgi:hypothetical protein